MKYHDRACRALFLAVALCPLTLYSQASRATVPTDAKVQQISDQIEQFILERALPMGGETSIKVQQLSLEQAQACSAADVFLPPGRKLDSTTTVAVRCSSDEPGARDTTFYVRADVQIQGPYYVASQAIAPNQTISRDMLEERSGDLLRLNPHNIAPLELLEGRIATQRIQMGSPIRMTATRSANSVQRGQRVRLVIRAGALTATNSGEVMATADVGARVQVKTEAGKIVQGRVGEDGTVLVAL